jgi:hypothetical protein
MTYFRELPDLEYQSFLPNKISSDQYLLVKNIFRRVKIRDDLQNIVTLFDKYQIPDGSRPETVAEEVYGSSQYDWVVLVTAGITRVRDQWPLSDRKIYDYAESIYGENLTDTHHYETKEIRDSQDRLILPSGKKVDRDFKISYYDNGKVYTNDTILGTYIQNIDDPITGVTNYEYEVRKNNEKRGIYILKPLFLSQVIKDIRKEMIYGQSSQYIDDKTIKTENTDLLIPQ